MAKLTELRRRTDQDLIALMRKDQERALTLTRVATTKNSPFYQQAWSIYRKLEKLAPAIFDRAERDRMSPRLAELRLALANVADHTRANCSSVGSAQQYQGSFR